MRLYFGSEFCEYLIPSQNKMVEVIDYCKSKQLQLSVVTPPVTSSGIKKITALFDTLNCEKMECEIILNDWGAINIVSEMRFATPVLGRLLNKSLREPRLYAMYRDGQIPGNALKIFQDSGISLWYKNFLEKYNITRIELDNLCQNLDEFELYGMRASLYVPFGYVAAGRMCLYGAIGQQEQKRFAYGQPCQKQCLGNMARMHSPNVTGSPDYLQQGNAVFYKQEPELVSRALSWAREKKSRIVVFDNPMDIFCRAYEWNEIPENLTNSGVLVHHEN